MGKHVAREMVLYLSLNSAHRVDYRKIRLQINEVIRKFHEQLKTT